MFEVILHVAVRLANFPFRQLARLESVQLVA
jgi:hypothetical protein